MQRTRGTRAALILGVMATLAVAGPVAAAAPSNDSPSTPRIISANTLSGVSGASNVGATFVGEPSPSCHSTVGATVWWRYRPPVQMDVSLDTHGSAFDTVMAVYKSTSNGLTQVACNDDSGGVTSALSFVAAASTAYYIQIGGFNGSTGSIQFGYSFHVTNDAFAKATKIAPGYTAEFNTATASTQPSEPHGCSSPGHTVWYRYTPTSTKRLSFDTFDSSFDSQVAVWRGTSLGGLTFVTCADDTDETDGDGSATWTAQANKTYYIQVSGYQEEFGVLRVNFVRLP